MDQTRNIRARPRIFVIGPIAAGKTTVRAFMREWLESRGYAVPTVSIEEIQRKLFPPENQDGTYYYDEEGALILCQRQRQIPAALVLFHQECQQYLRQTGFIAELAHQNIVETLLEFQGNILQNALITHVSAPLSMRLARNLNRKSLRIPSRIVRSIPEKLNTQGQQFLLAQGVTLRLIETSGSLENLRLQIYGVLENYLHRCA